MNNPLMRSNPKKVQSSALKPSPIISPLHRNPPLISPQISIHTPSVPPMLPFASSMTTTQMATTQMATSSMATSPVTTTPTSTSLASSHLPPSKTNLVSIYRQSIAPNNSSNPNVTRAMSTRSDDMYSIDIKFERSNSSYRPQELVCGTISLVTRKEQGFSIEVQRIMISVGGRLALQNKSNKAEYAEMVQHHRPIEFISLPDILVAQDKTLTAESRIPFRFKLEKRDHRYLETYIGMHINISYTVVVTVLFKDQSTLLEEVPFYIQVPMAGREAIDHFVYPKKKNFLVRSQDVSTDKPIGQFKIRGELESQICYMSEDLSGWLMVDIAESPLRSIDLQLLRVERVQLEGKVLNEKSQIQLIQICDGNVAQNLELPLYMILPRYFCCPSVKYLNYQVNFQINLIIGFRDGFKVTANIPLKILRS